ncbi:hypothetical protein IFM89_035984 [Coptis chinensis]|uniref:tRNA synthetases class I catalytic domain-containing protein n=1 Tax=Coptis chinensis TaxID=261450 RepID=A0A835M7X3_9MAGN|nr:hypothetical protein IFM89_035984 [Coptis chinensis]
MLYRFSFVPLYPDLKQVLVKAACDQGHYSLAKTQEHKQYERCVRLCLYFQIIFLVFIQIIKKARDDPLDMEDLQRHSPTHQPRVSDHIKDNRVQCALRRANDNIYDFPPMLAHNIINELCSSIWCIVWQIIRNGCAYEVDGDVFFAVDKSPNYGRLSGQVIEDNQAGKRVTVDSRKRNSADFVLWKASKPGEPSWESPWGCGRPGWHIECSAMSSHHLTSKFDIHSGGIDLIFPHHENEIAQSSAACSEANVKYWVHSGSFTRDGEKMSKSRDNCESIRKVTSRYHPLALRYLLMSMHYRSSVDYSKSQFYWQLETASDKVYYIYQALHDFHGALSLYKEGNILESTKANAKNGAVNSEAQDCLMNLQIDFKAKMANDLHVGEFLNSSLLETLKFMNRALEKLKKGNQQEPSLIRLFHALENEVKEVLSVLGLMSSSPYSNVLQQFRDKALIRAKLTEADVQLCIDERSMARKMKDYSMSNKIRDEMRKKGIDFMDVGLQTNWRPSAPLEIDIGVSV